MTWPTATSTPKQGRSTGATWLIGIFSFLLVVIPLTAATPTIDDEDITSAVENELLTKPYVAAHLVDVSTSNGVITLTGTVDSLLAKDKAEQVAETIKGTRSVVNRLDVNTPDRSDEALSTDVSDALLTDPATDAYDITVTADDGHVTLSGEIDSWAEKEIAGQVAKSVTGVTKLTNNITFEVVDERLDREIQAEIERRIELDPWIDSMLINVKVNNGKVALSGSVGSSAERSWVIEKAWISGVSDVSADDLDIRWWARDEMRRTSKYTPPVDSELEKAIEDAFLYDPRVASFKVDASSTNGFVTLTGTVDNLKAKRAAENDALNTRGVWTVDNRIKVRPVEEFADSLIRQNIIDAIERNAILPRSNITVTVYNGKAYLSGHVGTAYEKTTAGDVASRIAGVAAIENNITINNEWAWKSDWQIQQDARSQLYWSPFVDDALVSISVNDGVVTLTGTVDTQYQKTVASENAWDAGAKDVRNRLIVKSGSPYEDNVGHPPYLDPTNPGYYGSPYYPDAYYGG